MITARLCWCWQEIIPSDDMVTKDTPLNAMSLWLGTFGQGKWTYEWIGQTEHGKNEEYDGQGGQSCIIQPQSIVWDKCLKT